MTNRKFKLPKYARKEINRFQASSTLMLREVIKGFRALIILKRDRLSLSANDRLALYRYFIAKISTSLALVAFTIPTAVILINFQDSLSRVTDLEFWIISILLAATSYFVCLSVIYLTLKLFTKKLL